VNKENNLDHFQTDIRKLIFVLQFIHHYLTK